MFNIVKNNSRLCSFISLYFIFYLMAATSVNSSSDSQNTILKRIPCDANQGVAVDQKFYYAISNIKITKYDKATDEVISTWEANLENKRYKHFKHMNSGTVVGETLYCAHSRYGIDPNDNSVEIWNVKNELLEHEKTIRMPRKHGSLTWIDRHTDGSWWMCYAVYGKCT